MGRASRRPRRPFTLADLMVLVAATGVGLALGRWVRSGGIELIAPPPSAWSRVLSEAQRGFGPALVVAWSAALVVLRVVPPRPRWRRLIRQPGFVACAATLAGLAARLVFEVGTDAVGARPGSSFATSVPMYWIRVIFQVPYLVAGAWIALTAAGRWSSEASWIDRAGRAVGGYWVAWLLTWPILIAVQLAGSSLGWGTAP